MKTVCWKGVSTAHSNVGQGHFQTRPRTNTTMGIYAGVQQQVQREELKGREKPSNSGSPTREITIQHHHILAVLQRGSLSICAPFLPLSLVCFLHNLHCRWSSGCQELVLEVYQVCLGLARLWSWQHPAFLLLQAGPVWCSHGRCGKRVRGLVFLRKGRGQQAKITHFCPALLFLYKLQLFRIYFRITPGYN